MFIHPLVWVWSLVDIVRERENQLDSCPECNGQLIASQGYVVCTQCGLVISREYVAPTYQMGNEPSGNTPDAGMYVSLGSRLHIVDGMGSYIGFHRDRFFRDAQGRLLPSEVQKKFRRFKISYSTRARIGKDETMYRALRVLNHASKILMVNTQVRDRAAYIYKKLAHNPKTKTTNNILLIAVCLLMAVREFKEAAPITLEEIANVFVKLGHRISIRAMVREALRLKSIVGYAPAIRSPGDYVPRVVSMIMNNAGIVRKITSRGWAPDEYEQRLRDMIMRVIEAVPASKRGGRNPFIFTVSAAYASDKLISISAGKRAVLTQKSTSNATGVAEYSIRDHYGIIKQFMTKISSSNPVVATS